MNYLQLSGSYLEQSLAIHHPVKVLHNGRGPQKIKQERNFAKEQGDLIHSTLPLVIGEGVKDYYMVQCIGGVQLLKKRHLFNLKFTAF